MLGSRPREHLRTVNIKSSETEPAQWTGIEVKVIVAYASSTLRFYSIRFRFAAHCINPEE
ncbi:hypothetical protein ZHAS_00022099 [Anopheles sinensis]|uniref:Uncharacterized protein n=1 Tax=Anopheles sinensis TaxID=74873 RepID=A0A084WTY5_ANOSI|nr:hypothetical protein ZHAS_00022099 [Anopheles sinensis]